MKSRQTFCILLAALGLLLLSQAANARFIRPQLEETPVDRLTENLAKLADAKPKDLKLRLNLARTHAMAYALKTDKTKVWVGKESEGAWFGYTPAHVPFKAKPTDDPKKLAAAKEQLALAIKTYQQILKADPNHLTARLGHAWCLEQAEQDMRAIDEYRKTIELGWKKEKEMTRAGLRWRSVVKEASGYLVPLLDKKKDAAEIAKLADQVKHVSRIRQPITPIAIPLRENMTIDDVHDQKARVSFDVDGSGYAKTWTWISRDAAWLVYDHSSTGQITSGRQLFGNVTFWLFWDNGYHALGSLDDNRDGRVSGVELRGLALWHDRNGNGVSEEGEVQSMETAGVTSLSYQYEQTDTGTESFLYAPNGVTFENGTKRPTYDVILQPAGAKK
ncbi:MAG: hypothetical protein IH987_17225 [Planctomycetes bacterium]|nr:hypothetical protein [Planctomycetota bacterium]